MSAEFIRVIKMIILVPLAFFSVYLLLLHGGLSYLNQSIDTPENQRLTFYNYILPLLLSMGFVFYFTREQIASNTKTPHFNYILAAIIVISATWAIPWQIRQLKWLIERNIPFVVEWIPIIVAILFTIGSLIIQILNFIKLRVQD